MGIAMGVGWIVFLVGVLIYEACMKHADGSKPIAGIFSFCIILGLVIIGLTAVIAGSLSSMLLVFLLIIAIPCWILWKHSDGKGLGCYMATYRCCAGFAMPCAFVGAIRDLMNYLDGLRVNGVSAACSALLLFIMAIIGGAWKKNLTEEINTYRDQIMEIMKAKSDPQEEMFMAFNGKTGPNNHDCDLEKWRTQKLSTAVDAVISKAHYRDGHPLSLFEEIADEPPIVYAESVRKYGLSNIVDILNNPDNQKGLDGDV